MFNIKTFNKISPKGLDRFPRDEFGVATDISHPDAIILRSHNLQSMEFPPSLKAVGRAGAGTNNIPVDACSKNGVVVFNTPGANANAVKELVIAAIFLSARDIIGGINYSKSLLSKDVDIKTEVEKSKSTFAGVEIKGRQLGVIGLGAIGTMLANDAVRLGMNVVGHDPFLSVDRAWDLSNEVRPAPSLEKMFGTSDFISLHVPLTDNTKGFVNEHNLSLLKDNAVILNFSRSEIVDQAAMAKFLKDNPNAKYVSDFPSKEVLKLPNTISIPHLGASTKEAEENCAVMIADQMIDFLKTGNIRNSVNFPLCVLEPASEHRVVVANKNIPNMVSQITNVLATHKYNIVEMLNKSKGDIAYNILDLNGEDGDPSALESELRNIPGVIKVRTIIRKV